jgi:hypothetical protein
MEICNINYIKAREGEAAYFAGVKHTFRQRRIFTPVASNEIMKRRNLESEKDVPQCKNLWESIPRLSVVQCMSCQRLACR